MHIIKFFDCDVQFQSKLLKEDMYLTLYAIDIKHN